MNVFNDQIVAHITSLWIFWSLKSDSAIKLSNGLYRVYINA